MNQEEKQRKFHEALLKMLYPPPPSPPPQVTLSSVSFTVILPPFESIDSYYIFTGRGGQRGETEESNRFVVSPSRCLSKVPKNTCLLPHKKSLSFFKKENLDAGELEENNRNSSSSSSDDGSGEKGGSEKPTRSQRKRLRKRKFKEAASLRREIIGPLLPKSKDDGSDGDAVSVGKTLQTVRQDTALGSNTVTNNSGAQAVCTKKNKIKQRRNAKKVY